MTDFICPNCDQSFVNDSAEWLDTEDELYIKCPECQTRLAISVELVREYFVSLRGNKPFGGKP
jgi:DNA-directed RNA polymerase subunit RPC12/RpoP